MRKSNNHPRILILGGSSTISFNIARCIHEVLPGSLIGAVDSLPLGPCFHCDFISYRALVPQVGADPEAYWESLLRIIKKWNTDVVVPGSDHDTLFLARFAGVLGDQAVKCLVPGEAAVEIANNKQSTCAFADRHRIPQPRYVIAETADQAEAFATEIHPSLAVVKEVSTINSIAPTPVAARELATWFNGLFGGPTLIQEFTPGRLISVTTICLPTGDILEPIAMQKIATDGHGETLEGIVVNAPEIKEKSNEVLRLLNWVGAAEVEWIVDSRDGIPKLLEINSRFPAWILLSHWKGRNYPAYYVEYLRGAPSSPPCPPPAGLAFCRQPWDVLTGWSAFDENPAD